MRTSRLTPLSIAVTSVLVLGACTGGPSGGSSLDDQVDSLADADVVSVIEDLPCDLDAKPTGDPIVVGGSLSLTGPLAQTAAIHNATAEIVVEWVNECGGIDGRPLEWRVLDDQSTPSQAASNYERLINDGVDLVMGPYGSASILAAAAPVSREGYAFPTSTYGAPEKPIGDNHFPAWQIGGGVDDAAKLWDIVAQSLVDAFDSTGSPPKKVFYAAAQFPSTLSITAASRQAFEDSGAETIDDVSYQLGTTDFRSIALRISNADPDLVYLGGVGGDASHLFEAFNAIGYTPRGIFVAVPSPASIAELGDDAEGLMMMSLYENHAPLGDNDVARYFAQEFAERAEAESLFPLMETQAASSLGAWQILLTGVANAGVDNTKIIAWLNANEVEIISGKASFEGANNYGADFNYVTQIQNGERRIVWPEELADGAEVKLRGN